MGIDRAGSPAICLAQEILFVQDDAQERIVDLDSAAVIALVINEAEFFELIHK